MFSVGKPGCPAQLVGYTGSVDGVSLGMAACDMASSQQFPA